MRYEAPEAPQPLQALQELQTLPMDVAESLEHVGLQTLGGRRRLLQQHPLQQGPAPLQTDENTLT